MAGLGRVGLLGLAVAATVTVAGFPAAAEPRPASPDAVASVGGALAAARASGHRVEVTGQRTETTQVFANPSGTLTAKVAPQPVRVRRTDGSWTPVDNTLRRTGSGAVAPAASPLKLSLSGGGAGPLVSLTRDGRSVALGWPGRLPAPALKGDTATYPEVLPGVDLEVRVSVYGYSEVLVVKNRKAAANPALATVRFTTALSGGMRVVPDGLNGGIRVVDVQGNPAFGSGVPVMWDSARGGGRRADMPVTVSEGGLAITPDRAMLTSPSTVYPVYIDPSVSVGSNWTMINQAHPAQVYWNYDKGEGVAKVGYIDEDVDPGDTWEKYRSLFVFQTSAFAHKHVLSATFTGYLKKTYQCSATRTDLYSFGAEPGPDADWSNNSGLWTHDVGNVTNGNSSTCPPGNVGNLYTEIGGATGPTQTAANAGSSVTFGLRAYDESNHNGWKKFNTVYLVVNYNTVPAVPTNLTVDNKPCATGANRPYVGSVKPTFRDTVTDGDGDPLDVWFAWPKLNADGTYPTTWDSADTKNVQSGHVAQLTPSASLTDRATYAFRSQDRDGTDSSPVTGWCEFTIDNDKPNVPPTITSADGLYVADDRDHGGVGRTGLFTFDSNGVSDNGVDDVAGYRYGLQGAATTWVAAPSLGAPVTLPLAPYAYGVTFLTVESVDRAGNPSDPRVYTFDVGRATGPAARWTADEGSGSTLADSAGNGHTATLTGGNTWTTGRTLTAADKAVTFTGAGQAATAGPVLADTAKNYTVSAWVRLSGTGTSGTVLAEDGENTSALSLGYNATDKKWSFRVAPSDTAGATGQVAESATTAAAGTWTYLTGEYDTAAKQARLYVNGELAGSVAVSGTFTAAGPFVIGRGFAGDVDDVRVWDRIVYQGEVLRIIDEPELAGEWLLDDGTGTTAADTSGNQRPLALAGGAAFGGTGSGHNGLGALAFTGTGGRASTAGPVVDTSHGFTISAWVNPTALDGDWRTVVSMDGTAQSGVYLQYNKGNGWAFVMNTADRADPTGQAVARATSSAKLNTWTHLAGVYDPATQQIKLYVNGQLEGSAAYTTPWKATGPLHAGAAWTPTAWKNMFLGAIDDVRVYGGVLSDREIVDLAEQ
ncbi:MAG: LamG-like jellyroll fold domain-containing protein [Mycobacteriales bacterium]